MKKDKITYIHTLHNFKSEFLEANNDDEYNNKHDT